MIKNGFTNSIGWNLGSKKNSIHLLDPLTSVPIKGTNIKKKIDKIKIINENFKRLSLLIAETTKITIAPRPIKNKCLKKKEKSFVFNLSDAINDVDTKEKNKPVENNKIIKKNKNLSRFFHHS